MTTKELSQSERQTQWRLIGVRLELLAFTRETLYKEQIKDLPEKVTERMKEIASGLDRDQVVTCLTVADVRRKHQELILQILGYEQ